MTTTTLRILMDGYDAAVQAAAENIERVHAKHWEARLDVARTVVSIAAPIFAGVVIFLDKISSNHSIFQTTCLKLSWVLLVVSIIAGLLVFLNTVTLRSFHPKAFNGQIFVKAQMSRLDLNAADSVDQAAKITRQATTQIFDAIGRADRYARNATAVCLTSFGLAVICFLIYALVRII